MKKSILISITMLLALAFSAHADVGLVVQFNDSSIFKTCLDINDGVSGYDLLESSSLDLLWTDPTAFGRMLCKINNEGTNVGSTYCDYSGKYWIFSLTDNTTWGHAPVGFDSPGGCWNREYGSWDGHYCSRDGDVIGLVFGSGLESPTLHSFDNLCRKLQIMDVEVKVDSDTDDNILDGEKIKDDALPGSSIKVSVWVESMFTSSEALDVEDILVTASLRSIDDGDDFEEDADEFTLAPSKDKKVSIEFEIPLEVEEGTYDLDIDVVGEDEDGTEWTDSWTILLDVDKDRHNLYIKSAELFPSEVACSRTADLSVSLMNLGSDDEDESVLEIKSSALEINEKDEFELSSDPYDDESKFRKSLSFTVFDDLVPGTYPISIKTLYDTSKESDKKTVSLTVKECTLTAEKKEQEEEKVVPEPEKAEKEETKETAPKVQQISTSVLVPTYIAPKKSFFEKNMSFFVVLSYAVLIGAAMGLVVYLRRK